MNASTSTQGEITLDFEKSEVRAIIHVPADVPTALRTRVELLLRQADGDYEQARDHFSIAWTRCLPILSEVNTTAKRFGWTVRITESARHYLSKAKQERDALRGQLPGQGPTEHELAEGLRRRGFIRALRPFQLRDLATLVALPCGANFSVPGAGKTSVMLALHTWIRRPETRLLVVSPRSAFPAWESVVGECFDSSAINGDNAPVVRVDSQNQLVRLARAGGLRFVMTYDRLFLSMQEVVQLLEEFPVHLILDESHYIKAGHGSIRGAAALAVSPLPVRRDIMSGTPAPQSLLDLEPQAEFLYPGSDLPARIRLSQTPQDVLSGLFVRTRKSELGLDHPVRHYLPVPMSDAQAGLYAVVRDDSIRRLAKIRGRAFRNVEQARSSVMRLLALSSNPRLAATRILESDYHPPLSPLSVLCNAVLGEMYSAKHLAVADLCRDIVSQDRKVVIWAYFNQNVLELEAMLEDLGAISIYGATISGDQQDPQTREGKLVRFHDDPHCRVLVANPATCGEGISLHMVCHDAIYLERDYNAARYVQSIDRIHRLGLPPGTTTTTYVMETIVPQGLASIDHSVRRRLGQKISDMNRILNDEDIRLLALDELNSEFLADLDKDVEDLLDVLEHQPEIGQIEEEPEF